MHPKDRKGLQNWLDLCHNITTKGKKMSDNKKTSEWVSLDGYEVSNDGSIRRNGKEIVGTKTKKGYVRVKIHGRATMLHRIIATVFLGIPKKNQQVNHKNGIKNENRIENLEWCSPSENLKHAYKKLGRKASFENKGMPEWVKRKISNSLKGRKMTEERRKINSECHKGKGLLSKNPNAKKVICLETGKKYGSIKEASIDTGISHQNIGISIKKNKKIKNLTFKKEEK